MNFFDKNCAVIKSGRTFLHNNIQSYYLEHSENLSSDNINSVEAKDGNYAIVIEKGNAVYRLNSIYRPIDEAKKWVEQFNFHNMNIIVTMFGLGNGMFAREIMKNLDKQDMLFILEPSIDIFFHTLNNYDITDILSEGRVSISVDGINQLEFITLLGTCVNWQNLNSQINCVHPQYDKIFVNEYKNYLKEVNDYKIRAIVNKKTEAFWGVTMTKNEIANIKHLKNCNVISDYLNVIPKDIPAIIVSSGPSLDKNIEDLKKAKGKSIIIVVDSALKFLLAHDIVPDFVVTLDAKKSVNHFKDERFKSIPLFCKSVSNPAVLDLHTGKKIFFYNESFIGDIFEKLGRPQIYYSVGGSVSTAAFSICIGLGISRIVLVGQDLCFHGDVTHAGNKVVNAYNANQSSIMMVEDINGNQVKTRYDWYTYLLWFQDAISKCSNVDVINATEGGAMIKGARVMTLLEMIDQYCNKDFDVNGYVRDIKNTFNENELIDVKTYFDQSIKDLKEIEKLSKESIEICSKLIIEAEKCNISSYKSQELVRKITGYNKKIAEKSINQILNDYIAEASTEHLDTINQLTDDVKTNQIKTYMKSREIYKAMEKGAQEIGPLLEESIKAFN